MKMKTKEIPTSADQVGSRKSYRMTGKVEGLEAPKSSYGKKKKSNPGHKMKSHNPY